MCRNNNHTKLYAWRLNSQSQHPTDTYIHIHTYTHTSSSVGHHTIKCWWCRRGSLNAQPLLASRALNQIPYMNTLRVVYTRKYAIVYIRSQMLYHLTALNGEYVIILSQVHSYKRNHDAGWGERRTHKWHSLLNYSTLSVNRTRARTPCFRRSSQSWISTFKERLAWRCPFILYTRVRSRQVRSVWCVTPRWMRPSSPLPGVWWCASRRPSNLCATRQSLPIIILRNQL